jgi:diguanylate cyclase (GGDEF)-like protein/PAS domain S-box-containing protein
MNHKFDLLHTSISLEALFESMPVAMVLLDREGRHVAANRAVTAFNGLNPEQLIGRKVAEFSKESGENIERDFRMFDQGLEVPVHEVPIGDKICQVSVKAVRDESGYAVGEMVSLTDISHQKQVERELAEANAQLKFLANHDELTGVLNVRAYHEVCNRLMELAFRNDTPFSVLFVDLDHFKNVNDTHGHDIGDQVLRSVAKCMAQGCRGCDVIGRVGGEEFSIFLPETSSQGAIVFAEKLRESIAQLSITLRTNDTIGITASIGVASKMAHHKAIADIQRDADHAMYHAKKEGRNRVCSLQLPCYVENAMSLAST